MSVIAVRTAVWDLGIAVLVVWQVELMPPCASTHFLAVKLTTNIANTQPFVVVILVIWLEIGTLLDAKWWLFRLR